MSALTLDEVLFSWALAEAYSPRWRDTMLQALSAPVAGKLAAGETHSFSLQDREELIAAFMKRRADMVKGYITPFSAFRLTERAVESLESLPVLPQIGGWEKPFALGQFIDGAYSADTFHDPRNGAKRMLAAPEPIPYVGYPILSYSNRLQCQVLLEGYTRCITAVMKHRNGETLPPMQMIECVREK